MTLNTGTRFGPYEILSLLGAGGMGEVYKARDTRLGRDVAIKVLTSQIAGDPQSRARFQREARAVAALNHPHICTLHDVGSESGTDFLVMEYLEGETLADRVKRGPLAIDQALKLATQIGGALDNAHRAGIVHRDLKPSNVMLTSAGVKLLDFGLAKVRPPPHDGGVTIGISAPRSGDGTLTGTVPYMAPEQLEGRDADTRSDLFAFGAVLYEMVTGRRAFAGESQASVIAAILELDPPPIATLHPGTPHGLDRFVSTCLAKDPDDRWQTARDLVRELTWIAEGRTQDATHNPIGRRWWNNRERLAWSAGVLLLLVLAVLLGITRSNFTSQPVVAVRAPLLPPSESSFLPYTFATSPDGARVVFASAGADGNAALWVHTFAASNAQLLKGTEGSAAPFWSPDGRQVGFFAAGKLKTVDIIDGSVEILGEARAAFGGTWNRDGTIVFGASVAGPLYRISHGGVAAPVTRIPPQRSRQSHHFPFFLPDGNHFLYQVQSPDDTKESGFYIGSLDSSAGKRVAVDSTGNSAFAAFASGRLLYIRGRSLMAQPFDADRLEVTGPAVTVADGVETDVGGRPEFSVSQNGVLVFQSEPPPSRLMWFDAGGRELGALPILGSKYPRFSPDGHFLAFSSDDARDGHYRLHVYDLASGINRPLTDGASDTCPIWSSDGKEITYASDEDTKRFIYTMPVDGSGRRLQMQGARMVPNDWSPDNNLVFMDFSKGRPQLAIYSTSNHAVQPMSGESEAQFSPDGKWIAYSGPRGRRAGEIIVQRFPSLRGGLQVSTAGGGQPRWNHDGDRIFYLAPDKKLMSVTFDRQRMTAGVPQVLFQTRIVTFAYDFYQYDVAPDGRFLINSLPASFSSPLTLVTGWTALLKEH